MERVKEKGEELLAVVLHGALELRMLLADGQLEFDGLDTLIVTGPDVLEERRKLGTQLNGSIGFDVLWGKRK